MSPSRSHVVIIGGNFAGLVAASRLSSDHDVTVVDARADFEWTPNIHEILSGVKSRESVVLPRAECVNRYGHTFVQDVVTRIDRDSSTVITQSGLALPYDACLVAAGSVRTTFGVEGADQYALGLRSVGDAVRIAGRLDKLATRKRRASVVVVGGGVTGIEVVGEILRRREQGDEFNIHVVEVESDILDEQLDGLASDAQERFAPYPVTVHTNTAIKAGERAKRHAREWREADGGPVYLVCRYGLTRISARCRTQRSR